MQENHIAFLESLRIGLVLDAELVRPFATFSPEGAIERLKAASEASSEPFSGELIAAMEAAVGDREALAKVLRSHSGAESIPPLALRAFLASVEEEYRKLPGFKKSDLVPHVNLYVIAFEASKLVEEATDEAEFLELWHSHEMLGYHDDPDLLFIDKGRAADILGTFGYFLWLVWILEPGKLDQWADLNDKINSRWKWLKKEGIRKGKKFDNPLHLWRQETGTKAPETKKKAWSGKQWGQRGPKGKSSNKKKGFKGRRK